MCRPVPHLHPRTYLCQHLLQLPSLCCIPPHTLCTHTHTHLCCRAPPLCCTQYRVNCRVEQWLIKWKDYGEDRNTWEPWDNLLTEEVRQEASRIKDAALPSMAHKLTVPMLREALQAKGLESSGLKDALVARLKQAVSSP